MEHTNVIYFCSKEEWLEFTKTIMEEGEGIHIASLKYISNEGIRYNHTWYSKCYNTKHNGKRPTMLLVGRGCEFDIEVINRLEMALHPRDGVIQYGRA